MTDTLAPTAPSTVLRRPLDVPLGTPTRPSWRGRLHLVTLIVAVPLFATLVVAADGARARVGVLIYAAGLCAMLAVSVTYHRWVHTVRGRAMWRRADHATIFVAIAATSTPLCLVLKPPHAVGWQLVALWSIAAVGVAAKAFGGRRAHHVGNVLYIANGWAGALLLPALWGNGHVAASLLLVAGGVIYTVGAAGFARGWPVLKPSVFSYHEVWHAATIAAAGAHLAAVWMVTA